MKIVPRGGSRAARARKLWKLRLGRTSTSDHNELRRAARIRKDLFMIST